MDSLPADMPDGSLEQETTELLQQLIRFNTVNPPGDERAAIEHLAAYVGRDGFDVELLAADEKRPNLVADLHGERDGPTLCYLGHVDTVLADPAEWEHDPWSGDVADGCVWGRGALDMKSQVAAEAAAAVFLAREGWRPASGHLKLVFVADEETGGELGAAWLTEAHPEKVRCDMLVNEGAGEAFEWDGSRAYGVCCGEKGLFRFAVTARGTAGHASLPRTGDNALLKLGPVLNRMAEAASSFELTDVPEAMLAALGFDPSDPAQAVQRIAEAQPELLVVVEPMLGVTVVPTMAHASDKINVIPSRAELRVDCRVPPGLGEDAAWRRIHEVLGEDEGSVQVEFTETMTGNHSPADGPLMDAIGRWVSQHDPGARTLPVLLPGASDSRFFRAAFPECVAYGFFPQRHQGLFETAPLVHSANERVDVRDLGFAATFYADLARDLLGRT
jgi:acetylornithine deacetylase/succinyl-diaminopimelate desuccinylase-like protein